MNYFENERSRPIEPPSTSSMIPVTRYPGSFSAINTSKDNTTTMFKTPYAKGSDVYQQDAAAEAAKQQSIDEEADNEK